MKVDCPKCGGAGWHDADHMSNPCTKCNGRKTIDMIKPELTENAIRVLERRYLKKDAEGNVCEEPEDMFKRVAKAASDVEDACDIWFEKFYNVMARLEFMPNSPTLMNAGREMGMCSACFVIPVPDSIEGIFEGIKTTALTQKAGGGTGFSFSELRPTGARVKTSGGTTSGPISFMKVFAKATDAIQQGAFRRGANMGVMRVDHPDIIEFINMKSDLKEMQNFNVSVMMTDEFMSQLETNPFAQHPVSHPKWGRGYLYRIQGTKKVEAHVGDKQLCQQGDRLFPWSYQDTWDLICDLACANGEPGILFYDTINADNNVPGLGSIEATNPCGEQPIFPYDSCTLGSINLAKMLHPSASPIGDPIKAINRAKLREVTRIAVRFLDNIVEINNYPVPEMRKMADLDRRIGIGVMGFADLLFILGVPYDSGQARVIGKEIMEVISKEAEYCSSALGEEKGNFGAWGESVYGVQGIPMRNAHRVSIAPTGTISIIANCSGGIEPMFALKFQRQVLADDQGVPTTMTEVNQYFLNTLEVSTKINKEIKDFILDYVKEHGSLHGFPVDTRIDPHGQDGVRRIINVFKTAHEIDPKDHLLMQAACQKYVDTSISKTINLPRHAQPEDVAEIYKLAWTYKCKGVSVYRDGCREGKEGMSQPMIVKKEEPLISESSEKKLQERKGGPVVDPDFATGDRVRLKTQFGTLHLKVFLDTTLRHPMEVFAQIGKGGLNINADLEGMCRLISTSLQNGGSLDQMIHQLNGIASTMYAPTAEGKIYSLPDALAKALIKWKNHHDDDDFSEGNTNGMSDRFDSSYGVPCPAPDCDGTLEFQSGCRSCPSCGWSKC